MINVIGLGYIGLPTALAFATSGQDVVGSDCNPEVVAQLRSGKARFNEPGLNELYAAALEQGVRFSDHYERADVYIVAVPTPYDKFTNKVDATQVVKAIDAILAVAPQGAIIVVESTLSPGAIRKSVRPLLLQRGFKPDEDVYLAHAPERIIPGAMLRELRKNNRIIGCDVPEIGEKLKTLYSAFCEGEIVVTDVQTAEMCKVVENTFRAVNIAFANELARICRYEDMNVYEVIRICNMHPRVNILQPGPGVGGHCISVDPRFLIGDYPSIAKVVAAAMETNDSAPDFVLERIREIMRLEGLVDTSRVGLYGLTYKENVDDVRESPTLQLLELQRRRLAQPLNAYDPYVTRDLVERQFHDLDAFLDANDLVVIMVKHQEIIDAMDKLKGKIILDCHNVCNLPNAYRL